MPPTGSACDRTANASSPTASTSSGTEMKSDVIAETPRSNSECSYLADHTARGTEISQHSSMAMPPSNKVCSAGARSSCETGVL